MKKETKSKNNRTALLVVAIVFGMAALSFAAVPLYRIFCAKTGFGGTPMLSAKAPDTIAERTVTVTFDARVDNSLPWEFKPEQRKVTLKIGQQGFINFIASNLSAKTTTGTAVYNVTPEMAGTYFHKMQCFCFNEQAIKPGGTAHFPVVFFIDPSILKNDELDDLTDITLSYTFFATNSKALDKAIENFGQTTKE